MHVASRSSALLFGAIFFLAATGAVRAERDCAAPLEDWQPREALARKLEESGLKILKLRIDDGCYLVWQVDANGAESVRKYDPATLIALPDEPGRHHREHDHGGQNQGQDGEGSEN